MRAIFLCWFLFLSNHGILLNYEVPLENFHVCTVATQKTDGFNMLMNSAKKHSIDIDVLGMGERFYGLSLKLIWVRNYLEKIPDDHVVLFVDGYDVFFCEGKREILRKFHQIGAPFVIAAETGCWTHSDRLNEFPPSTTPFRYLNSGSYIGYVKNVKAILSALQPDHRPWYNDQFLFIDHYLQNKNLYHLDTLGILFLPLYGIYPHQYRIDPKKGTVYFFDTKTEPSLIHGNGPKEAWEEIGWALGYAQ
jgi:hypothetical protein